jgi:tetratricopeptide (TPR) repeat protein
MRRNTWLRWLPLGLLLVGAASAVSPDNLVRQGNAAFAREDYDAAEKLYTEAEARSTDPGLVAQNKAAALYRLGRYAEAERYYRLCLQDATGERRARVLYGLANALVQKASSRDARALREAVGRYEQCLQQEGADAELLGNARHNLELAKLLWLQAKDIKNPNDSTDPDRSDQDPKLPDTAQRHGNGSQEPGPGMRRPGEREPAKSEGQQANPTDEHPSPGVGNLETVPDKAEVLPGSAEETRTQLREAATRILRERRDYQQMSAKLPASEVKNW